MGEEAAVAAEDGDPVEDDDDEDEEDEFLDGEEEEEEELVEDDEDDAEPQGAVAAAVNELQLGLGAAHEALLQNRDAPTGFMPYHRPDYFPLRVREMKRWND